MGRRWTAADMDSLPLTIPVVEAGEMFGISRTKAYELAKAGEFPVPVLKLGSRLVVPTAAIRRVLGYEPEAS